MARPRKRITDTPDDEPDDPKTPRRDDTKFLQLARERWAQVIQADNHQDLREKEDLAFLIDPWPAAIRRARSGEQVIAASTPTGSPITVPPRPCISIDKLSAPIRSVLNQALETDYGVSIVASDDFGEMSEPVSDEEIEIREGLVRRIQRESEAQDARLWAFDRAVKCGRGYYGVMTKYVPGKTWDQEVVIRRFYNQGNIKLDPAHEEPDGSDAEWAFITSWLPLAEYRAQFPRAANGGKNPITRDSEFETAAEQYPEWFTDDGDTRGCLVVEYFYTKRTTRALALLPNGDSAWVDELPEGVTPTDTRDVEQQQVYWAKIDGAQVLEETVWPGRFIPLIKVLGEEVQPFDQQRREQGLIRPSRESSQAFNFVATKFVEVVGLSSLPTVMMEEGQEEGHENEWAARPNRPMPFVRYKRTNLEGQPANPPAPIPSDTPVQPLAVGLEIFGNAIKDVTGVPSATLGEVDPGLKTKGAVQMLLQQARHGTSHYMSHLVRSMRYEAEIVNDLLYPIYGKRPGRLARVINGQNEPESLAIGAVPPAAGAGNPATGPAPVAKTYTLSPDVRFSVAINISKSFDTRRENAEAILGQIVQADPAQMAVVGDLLMKMADVPLHKELADRYRVMLAPPIQQLLAQQAAEKQGAAPIPPEVQQQLAQIPQLQAQLQEATQIIQKDQVKVQGSQQEAALKADADLQKAQLDQQTKTAQMESNERIAALNAQTELAKVQATLDAKMAESQIAAENQRAIEIMKLGHAAELEAKRAAHEAEQKDKDRALASMPQTKTVKKINRDANGRLESVSEETVQ